VAEDCLLLGFDESLLTRKLTLNPDDSVAIYDPKETLMSSLNFMRDGHFVRLHVLLRFSWQHCKDSFWL